mmetsp:Transcript_22897/g.54454  ORF Transcript_22897/g.54454 Transcript_22897/m.54454 type:complete len:313 (+) Transcript_22897:345-1283(+)
MTPPMLSSTCAPKMMLASGSDISNIAWAAALTSCSVMSLEPVMVSTMPLASAIGKSMSGDETAATAASCARFLPSAVPIPMSARPEPPMTLCTSAKSTLIMPALTMMSEMPTTPWRRMSSATQNASWSGVPSSTRSSSLSLETTIRMSTCCVSSSMASSACCMRRRPSKENGLVTIPTVSVPACLASSATTGAAPEPVPPPMPAVTKTMSTPRTSASISAEASMAAARPTAGTPPAPRPRAVFLPRVMVVSAREEESACMSVLHATYSRKVERSTPGPSWTMRLSVLPPPPPTPMTLIVHGDMPGATGCRFT